MAASASTYVMTRLLKDINAQLSEFRNAFDIHIEKSTWFHPQLWIDFAGRKYLQTISECCRNFPHETFVHSLTLIINKFAETEKREELKDLNLLTLFVFCYLVVQFPNKGIDPNCSFLMTQLIANKLLTTENRPETILMSPIRHIIESASLDGADILPHIFQTLIHPFDFHQFFGTLQGALCTCDSLLAFFSDFDKLFGVIPIDKRSDFYDYLYSTLHTFSIHYPEAHTEALRKSNLDLCTHIFLLIYDSGGQKITSNAWPSLAFIAPFALRTYCPASKDQMVKSKFLEFFGNICPTVGRVRTNFDTIVTSLFEFVIAYTKMNDSILDSQNETGLNKLASIMTNNIQKTISKASLRLLESYTAYELHNVGKSKVFNVLLKAKEPESLIAAFSSLQLYMSSYPTPVQIHDLPSVFATETIDIIIKTAQDMQKTDISNHKQLNSDKDILDTGLRLLLKFTSPSQTPRPSIKPYKPSKSGGSNSASNTSQTGNQNGDLLEFATLSVDIKEIETSPSLTFFIEPLLEPGKLKDLISSLITLLTSRQAYCTPKIMLFMRDLFRPFNRWKKTSIIEVNTFYSTILTIIKHYQITISNFLTSNSALLEHILECQQQFILWLIYVISARSSNALSQKDDNQIAHMIFSTQKLIECYHASRFDSWIEKEGAALSKFCTVTNVTIPTKPTPDIVRAILLSPLDLFQRERSAQDCLKMSYSLLKDGESLSSISSGTMTKELINKLMAQLSNDEKPGREVIFSLRFVPKNSVHYFYDAIYAESKKLFSSLAFESGIQLKNLILAAKTLPLSDDLELRINLGKLFVEMLSCNPAPKEFFILVSSVSQFLISNLENAQPSQTRLFIFWSLVDLFEYSITINVNETEPICSLIQAIGVTATGASVFDANLERASYFDTFRTMRETFGVILKCLNMFLEHHVENAKVRILVQNTVTILLRDNYEVAYDVYLSFFNIAGSNSYKFKEILANAISQMPYSSGTSIDNDKIKTPAFTVSFASLQEFNSPIFYDHMISFYWYFQKHWDLLKYAIQKLKPENHSAFFHAFIERCFLSSHYDLTTLLTTTLKEPHAIASDIVRHLPIPGALARFFKFFNDSNKSVNVLIDSFLEPFFREPIFYASSNNTILVLNLTEAEFDIPAVISELRKSSELKNKINEYMLNPLPFEAEQNFVKPYLGLIQFLSKPRMVVDELSTFISHKPNSTITLLPQHFSITGSSSAKGMKTVFSNSYEPGTIPSKLEIQKLFIKLRNSNALGKFGKGLWLLTLNSIPDISLIPMILLCQFFSLHFTTSSANEDISLLIDFAMVPIPEFDKIKSLLENLPVSVKSQIKAVFLINIATCMLDYLNMMLSSNPQWVARVIVLDTLTEACNMFPTLPLRESSYAPSQSLNLCTEVNCDKGSTKIGFSHYAVFVQQHGMKQKQNVTAWQTFPYSKYSIVEMPNGVSLRSSTESVFLTVSSKKGQMIKSLIEFEKNVGNHRKQNSGFAIQTLGRTRAAFTAEMLIKMSCENDAIYTAALSAFQRVINGYEGDETMAPGFGLGRTTLLGVSSSLTNDHDFLEIMCLFIEKAVDAGTKTVEKCSLLVKSLIEAIDKRHITSEIQFFVRYVLTIHLRRADLTKIICRLVWSSVKGDIAATAAEMVVDPVFEPRQALQILTALSEGNEEAPISAVLNHQVSPMLLSPLLQGYKKIKEPQLLLAFQAAFSFKTGSNHKEFGVWDVEISSYSSFVGRNIDEDSILDEMKKAASKSNPLEQLIAMIPPTKAALTKHLLLDQFLKYLDSKTDPEYLFTKLEITQNYAQWNNCIKCFQGNEPICLMIIKGAVQKGLAKPLEAVAITLKSLNFPEAFNLLVFCLTKDNNVLGPLDVPVLIKALFSAALQNYTGKEIDNQVNLNIDVLEKTRHFQHVPDDAKRLIEFTEYLLGAKTNDKKEMRKDMITKILHEKYFADAVEIAQSMLISNLYKVRTDRIVVFFLKVASADIKLNSFINDITKLIPVLEHKFETQITVQEKCNIMNLLRIIYSSNQKNS